MVHALKIRGPEVERTTTHTPVLLAAVVALLRPRSAGRYLDATLGTGGHAAALLESSAPAGRVWGIDRDPQALAAASARLARFGERFVPIQGNHDDLPALLPRRDALPLDGVLFDLGVSSLQLDTPRRGFSFRHDGPLDMRMGPDAPTTAAELIARLSRDELRELLRRYGEEPRATAIARAIERARDRGELQRTSELAALVERVAGPQARARRTHPATRTFQALRIAVNGEVDRLATTVRAAATLLGPEGRIVVISYHSLEDRAVKHALRELAERCTCPPKLPVCACGKQNLVRVLTRRAVRPSEEEVRTNPRARSARLRAAERLA